MDSINKGIIAQQGNTKIEKTDSGKLAYSTSAEKPLVIYLNTLATPRGGQYQLGLPDGTKVWLNAASSITYPTAFTGKERKVTITGEAYFEVVHNTTKPFKVFAKGTEIEDLGTYFNVNAYDDFNATQVKTTLLQGSIKIYHNQSNKIIKPGEQAVSDQTIDVLENVDLDNVMAWQRGKMDLNSETVAQIMREISRWYDVDEEYQGSPPSGKFYGSINRNVPLSSVLHVLKAYGVNTRLEGKKLIVLQ